MTSLSLKLSRALNSGRRTPLPPASRASLLAILLRKRATAHNVGDEELEALLRDQIRWALPIERRPAEAPPHDTQANDDRAHAVESAE